MSRVLQATFACAASSRMLVTCSSTTATATRMKRCSSCGPRVVWDAWAGTRIRSGSSCTALHNLVASAVSTRQESTSRRRITAATCTATHSGRTRLVATWARVRNAPGSLWRPTPSLGKFKTKCCGCSGSAAISFKASSIPLIAALYPNLRRRAQVALAKGIVFRSSSSSSSSSRLTPLQFRV